MNVLNNRFRLKYWSDSIEDQLLFSMTGVYHWNDILNVIKQIIPKGYSFRLRYNSYKYTKKIDTSDNCLTLDSLREKLTSIWYTIPFQEELEKENPVEDIQMDYNELPPEIAEDIFEYYNPELYEEYPQDYYDQYPPARPSEISIKDGEISFEFEGTQYKGTWINTYNIPDVNNDGASGTYIHVFIQDNVLYEVSEKWQYWYDDLDYSFLEVKILCNLKYFINNEL